MEKTYYYWQHRAFTTLTEQEPYEIPCGKLVDTYTHSLILCKDAEDRVQDTVSQLLTSKDNTIIELQQTVTSLKEFLSDLQGEIKKIKAE